MSERAAQQEGMAVAPVRVKAREGELKDEDKAVCAKVLRWEGP